MVSIRAWWVKIATDVTQKGNSILHFICLWVRVTFSSLAYSVVELEQPSGLLHNTVQICESSSFEPSNFWKHGMTPQKNGTGAVVSISSPPSTSTSSLIASRFTKPVVTARIPGLWLATSPLSWENNEASQVDIGTFIPERDIGPGFRLADWHLEVSTEHNHPIPHPDMQVRVTNGNLSSIFQGFQWTGSRINSEP